MYKSNIAKVVTSHEQLVERHLSISQALSFVQFFLRAVFSVPCVLL